ncbi:hypothetical protein AAF712_001301 [Marasmius tenuissimus]|uniref:Nucleolus and neural progenitor protein-like N-terminal domain-containing protein n=1 Tax=Marasmius tenuissimus TaxID=585030 RepID=A0ABR3ADF2_9AGAR
MKHSAKLKRTERADLPQSHHPRVDAALKDLKRLSKRLHSALSTYESELKVLERIYYKSKNQHRSALFWRRITETRRYGRRVEQTDLRTFVDALRLSFFREDKLALLSSELGDIVLDIKSAVIRLQEIYKPVEADPLQEYDAAHIQIPSPSNVDQSHDSQTVESSQPGIPSSSPSSLPRAPKELDADPLPRIAVQVHKATPTSRKEQVTSQLRPKKKKKKDEIDAIFGL